MGITYDGIGFLVKPEQSHGEHCDPESAGMIFCQRLNLRRGSWNGFEECGPGQYGIIMNESTRTTIIPVKRNSSNPQISVPIEIQCVDEIVGNAKAVCRFMTEVYEAFPRAVKSVQSILLGRDPEFTGSAFANCPDGVGADAPRICFVVPVVLKSLCFFVVAIEPALVGADPQRAVPVFTNRPDRIVRQRR